MNTEASVFLELITKLLKHGIVSLILKIHFAALTVFSFLEKRSVKSVFRTVKFDFIIEPRVFRFRDFCSILLSESYKTKIIIGVALSTGIVAVQ